MSSAALPAQIKQYSQLLPLLATAEMSVQLAIYTIATKLVKSKTDDLVLLLETKSREEEAFLPELALPAKLVDLVKAGGDSRASSPQKVCSVLLSWLLIFQHFEDAVSEDCPVKPSSASLITHGIRA